MSLLGELKPDSTKALSISLRVDVVAPIYEITYTVDSEEYVIRSEYSVHYLVYHRQ